MISLAVDVICLLNCVFPIPASLNSVYRLHTLALPVPGDQGLVSRRKGLPPYVIDNIDSGRIGELQKPPKFPVVAADHVLWHTDSNPSFLGALSADQPELVAEYCEFTV
jgi:hypothetical protein